MTLDRFKFRVWDLDAKSMQWPSYLPCNPNYLEQETIYNTVEDGINTFYETCPPNPGPIEEYIIMQCTGLKDKNGKLIFEGDIVDCRVEIGPEKWEPRLRQIVEWDETVTGFYLNNGYMHESDEYEVIGNIYEHPELLK